MHPRVLFNERCSHHDDNPSGLSKYLSQVLEHCQILRLSKCGKVRLLNQEDVDNVLKAVQACLEEV